MNEAGLVPILAERLEKFSYEIVDEDLAPDTTAYLRYDSLNKEWLGFPREKVRVIAAGVETYIFPTDYVVNIADGYITFSVARSATDTIRVDYFCKPFSAAQLLSIVQAGRKQMQVISFHTIDPNDIPENYQEMIIKRCYTIALRELQFPAVKYFSISVGGRTMDKSTQVATINAMIESNEKDLLSEINAVRYFDKTNVIT